MELSDQRVLITGAAGGIGRELCAILRDRGARLGLVERHPAALTDLRARLGPEPTPHGLSVAADIGTSEGRQAIFSAVDELWDGAVDVVIHGAAIISFAPYHKVDPAVIQAMTTVNVAAPLLVTRGLLPAMIARGRGRVVLLGSILGALAMPYFTAYSASKFALRGFAEGLRRELPRDGVGVTYVGPRSVRTALNAGPIERMAAATGMHVDEPAFIAARIVQAIERDRDEVFFGFPEALFCRVNALFPRLVDRVLRRQGSEMLPFAEETVAEGGPG